MSKQKISFACTNCDYRPAKWIGCCTSCNEWNSIVEIAPTVSKLQTKHTISSTFHLKTLDQVSDEHAQRMESGIAEWDRVLGGGIVPGSFLILTGDPGIGKSTLLLQVAAQLSEHYSVVYFSSEESLEQVKRRAQRLKCDTSSIRFSDTAQLETIISVAQQEKPNILIVDSIQNCFTEEVRTIPGSVGQLREAAFALMRLAKENNIAILLTGHITKEGTIAGPKLLEHMVDGVFYLQGDDQWQSRMLRSVKNRFGAISELGFFNMNEQGMQEVPNINKELLHQATYSPGSALVSHLEGSRPLLLELQALTIPAKYGIPQRVITGIDHKQVVLIASILEKYVHVKFSEHDIFFKVSGGFKIKDSASDLGIACALLSSFYQKPLPEKTIFLGELSLTGHIKPIHKLSLHAQEASHFGLEQLVIAAGQPLEQAGCTIKRMRTVYELLSLFTD
jgi:DNA repair protein RadA/Sms